MMQGAESTVIITDQTVIKKREPKAYRHPHIDATLTKSRIKSEVKILEKVQKLTIPVPIVLHFDNTTITMTKVGTTKVRDVLPNHLTEIATQLGTYIHTLHDNDIVHGDLTTSNMMWDGEKVWLIDFGLSTISKKIEDKAVDLHVLKEALQSYHTDIAEEFYNLFTHTYTKKEVLNRLVAVEKRGKNKH